MSLCSPSGARLYWLCIWSMSLQYFTFKFSRGVALPGPSVSAIFGNWRTNQRGTVYDLFAMYQLMFCFGK